VIAELLFLEKYLHTSRVAQEPVVGLLTEVPSETEIVGIRVLVPENVMYMYNHIVCKKPAASLRTLPILGRRFRFSDESF